MQQKIVFLLTVSRMLFLEVFFLSALLISSEKTTADRSCRRLPRNKGWLEEVWNTYIDQRFKKTFRVPKSTFNFILGRIQIRATRSENAKLYKGFELTWLFRQGGC